MVIRLNKANNELKEEISNIQKDLSLKFSENVKVHHDIAIESNVAKV